MQVENDVCYYMQFHVCIGTPICCIHYGMYACIIMACMLVSLWHVCLYHYGMYACIIMACMLVSLWHVCLYHYGMYACIIMACMLVSLWHVCLYHYGMYACIIMACMLVSLWHVCLYCMLTCISLWHVHISQNTHVSPDITCMGGRVMFDGSVYCLIDDVWRKEREKNKEGIDETGTHIIKDPLLSRL